MAPNLQTNLPSILAAIENQTGLSIENTSGSNYIIRALSRDYCLLITTGEGSIPVDGVGVSATELAIRNGSDKDGILRFTTALSFQDSIKIRHLGYATSSLALGDLQSSDCIEIPLVPQALELEEVVITNYITEGISTNLLDQSISIEASNLALLPGETDSDILLALRTLPGITAPNGKAGNLHIRGGTTDQSLLLFDNIPIYHKGHYYGAISPYNPAVVERVSVYRSGFDPSIGGRVGGAIKVDSRRSLVDSAHYNIGLNSYYAGAAAQIPISGTSMITLAARLSYPGNIESPKLQAINDMVYQPSRISTAESSVNHRLIDQEFSFYDVNISAVHNMDRGQLFLSLLGISNLQSDEIENLTRMELVAAEAKLDNYGANLQWQQFWSNRFSSTINLMSSSFGFASSGVSSMPNGPVRPLSLFDNTVNDLGFSFDGELLLGSQFTSALNFGYQFQLHDIKNIATSMPGRPPPNNPPPPNPPPPPGRIVTSQSATVHAASVNYKLQGSKFMLSAGARANYYTETRELFLEPRLMASYKFSKLFTLKTNLGQYSQFINQLVFFDFDDIKVENFTWSLSNDDQPVVRGDQVMIGAVMELGGFLFDVEGYYKRVQNLSILDPIPPMMPPGPSTVEALPTVQGDLTVVGIDFLLRKQWPIGESWISYSILDTNMEFLSINQLDFKTYYDQPHVFNVASTFYFDRWKASFGWNLVSGTPVYTNSNFIPEPGPPEPPMGPPQTPTIPSETNEGRFPAQHQLDVALVYDFSPAQGQWRGSVGLSILNVYNQTNIVEENIVTFGAISPNASLQRRYNIGFAPNLMVNLKF